MIRHALIPNLAAEFGVRIAEEKAILLAIASPFLFCSISFIVQAYDNTLVAHALFKLFEYTFYKSCRFLIDNRTAHDSSSFVAFLSLDNFSPVPDGGRKTKWPPVALSVLSLS